tara:strand:+ start:233 stop:514 length:282 start_codon:yes stop_codon:yes gene_type:complete
MEAASVDIDYAAYLGALPPAEFIRLKQAAMDYKAADLLLDEVEKGMDAMRTAVKASKAKKMRDAARSNWMESVRLRLRADEVFALHLPIQRNG